jgi:hypothetical protein
MILNCNTCKKIKPPAMNENIKFVVLFLLMLFNCYSTN